MSMNSQSQSRSPEPTSARRKSMATKRRVIQSDEEYSEGGDEDETMRETEMEVQRPASKRVKRAASTSPEDPDELHMDVDIDGQDDPSTTAGKQAGGKRRRSAATYSGDDADYAGGDDDNNDDFRDVPSSKLQLSDDDFDHELPRARSKPVRTKTATWKVRDGEEQSTTRKVSKKPGAVAKSAKGKATKKEKEKEKEKEVIMVKDERKLVDTASTGSAPPKLSRTHSASKVTKQGSKSQTKDDAQDEDTLIDVVDEPTAPLKDEGSPPPVPALVVPPKKKLPTIRKNKPVASGSGTSTPSQPISAKSTMGITIPVHPDTKPLGIAVPRQPTSSDFDLRDKGAWAAIFKSSGGSTPRSGLSRREKEEERRKELYRMRDDARAKREEALRSTFDLQAQWDKISIFEETLKQQRSSVLFPNIFAAKFRDEYERNKRQKEKEMKPPREHEPGAVEEGEMMAGDERVVDGSNTRGRDERW